MKSLSVPVRFRRCKIKHITEFSTVWTPSTTDDEAYQGLNTWVTIGDLKSKLVYSSSKSISDFAVREKGIPLSPKGSLLFSFKLSVGNVSFAAKDLYTNEAIATFRKSSTLSLDYAFYAFPIFIPLNASENIYGAKLLNQDLIANAEIFIPEYYEQRQIAVYLNRETAKIDKLIAKQEQLIKLLQEKRRAVISQAVTKGLDPNVKMKDSGVTWLGEVPEHWKVQKLRWIFHLVCESSDNDHGMKLLSVYTDIGVKPRAELEARGNKASNTDGYWIVKKGDVIVNKLLAWMGALGVSEYDGVTSPAYDILRPRAEMNSRYFSLIFRSGLMQTEIKRYSKGIMEMRLRIYFDQLGNLLAPVPSYEEQCQIVEHVKNANVVYERLEERALASISLLKEHRQALITAAVTGKIDVRGLVADEEVAALDADPVLETTEEDFESEVAEADYITEEE